MNYPRKTPVQFGEYEALETFDRAYARASRRANASRVAAAQTARMAFAAGRTLRQSPWVGAAPAPAAVPA